MPITRILVVDDNPANLKLVAVVLESDGYRVNNAASAEIALERIREIPPDLILMDIELPGMDGLTLTRTLKADSATRDIPVVALTAFAMKADEQRARDAGCDGYITKPVNTRTISAQVREFLRLKKVRPSPARSPSMKILVVEDGRSDLKLASAILNSAGHDVAEAESAEQALAVMRGSLPELILLDLKLPGINGLDLIRQLKANPSTRDIPIVAVTSYPDDWTEREARETGCASYFAKPLDTYRLLEEIGDIAVRSSVANALRKDNET
jgi:two-component system cell cycle response regulator